MTFLEEKVDKEEKEDKKDKEEKFDGQIEKKTEIKIGETLPTNKIETDYYDKDFVEHCAKKIKDRFNPEMEILPVRYGKSDKIYGYYILITLKNSGDKERMLEFIKEECRMKVFG